MTDRYPLAVVIGSVRPERIGDRVGDWFVRRVRARGDADVDVIDLAALTLPQDLGGGGDAARFAERIDRAHAVVLVTPEYNHGYPGPLKTAVDSAYEQWYAKPVGFVSYGGSSGGLRAVEQLRAVLAELHVVTMQTGVTIPHVHDALDEHGELTGPNAAHAERAAATVLAQLGWWARALARARLAEPYPG